VHTSATNFAVLRTDDEQLMRLGLLAEGYFADDPNTSLLKLRQLTELLAQHVATRVGQGRGRGACASHDGGREEWTGADLRRASRGD